MERRPGTRRAATAGALLAATLAAAPASHGAASDPGARVDAAGRPALAYATDDRIVVVDRTGAVVSDVRRGFGGYSLGGDLLAKAYATPRGTVTVGRDARTGDRRFRIRDTLLIPTVVRGGRAVAFAGSGERDPYATSLWLRNGAGRERELAQFSFDSRAPGIPTGMSEGLVLDYSFDRDADRVAVAAGDDIVTFDYDIWVVDVRSGDHVRLTRGERSRYPTLSPNGERVAYFREDSLCGGPMPGYRGGDLLVVGADGTQRFLVHDGTCDRYFDHPRWLDDDLLVATLHTRRAGEDPEPLYDSRLVLIDPERRVMSQPISPVDRIGQVSVSPTMRRIAYTDWTRPEGFWVFTWKPASGLPAHQEAWAQGTTRRFDVGRVPHLRDDSTLIPSY